MAVQEILQLGNQKLYEVSEEVTFEELNDMKQVVQDLHDTMMDFRKTYGVGRAIAAPQIGVRKRVLYMNIDKPVAFINPELVDKSEEMMELWDDCMCFPNLLVWVKRHKSLTIKYRDLNWEQQEMKLSGDLAELLQHEYDHLDGILAVMRAVDGKSFAFRSEI
ncbi:MAG: N-formylmethionyl-tRNA deformylase [Clostridia bacterium]|jgi:peptide deformylase|nr:N-formylmethionyl-tRNA deformylase [Clostridia bacterium]